MAVESTFGSNNMPDTSGPMSAPTSAPVSSPTQMSVPSQPKGVAMPGSLSGMSLPTGGDALAAKAAATGKPYDVGQLAMQSQKGGVKPELDAIMASNQAFFASLMDQVANGIKAPKAAKMIQSQHSLVSGVPAGQNNFMSGLQGFMGQAMEKFNDPKFMDQLQSGIGNLISSIKGGMADGGGSDSFDMGDLPESSGGK